MAPEGRSWVPPTPELVSVVVLAVTVSLPFALVGLSTVTGWNVARGDVLGAFWFGLGLSAVGSLFAAPYGAVLGVATLPVAVRTGAGYGTPTASGGFDGPGKHVAGAVLYAGLSTFAAGAALWAVVGLPPGPSLRRLGPTATPSALLAGGLVVAATFFVAQVHHCAEVEGAVDDGTVGWYALHAAGLLPAPFAVLVVLEWLFPIGILDVILLSPG